MSVTLPSHAPHVVDRAEEVEVVARLLATSESIPLDVESNGLHAYRARLCTLQLADVREGETREVFVIDAIALPDEALAPLRAVLSTEGPKKILHDLAFDARILAKHGVALGNVLDTAIAARFLAMPSTGLASVVQAKLGVKLSKELQHHDWGKRPLEPEHLPYLASDVLHLPAVARILFEEAAAKDIVPEIEAETSYRLSSALVDDGDDPRPPYVRVKGVQGLDPAGRAILRRLAELREESSRRADLPPFKVVGNDVLLDIAKTRKIDASKVRGRAGALLGAFRRAVEEALAEGDVPESDRHWFVDPPKPPRAEIEARRGREQRLVSWRKQVAKERAVDEQVVLPGHCVQDLADRAPETLEALGQIPGLGARRLERDGIAILARVRGS